MIYTNSGCQLLDLKHLKHLRNNIRFFDYNEFQCLAELNDKVDYLKTTYFYNIDYFLKTLEIINKTNDNNKEVYLDTIFNRMMDIKVFKENKYHFLITTRNKFDLVAFYIVWEKYLGLERANKLKKFGEQFEDLLKLLE